MFLPNVTCFCLLKYLFHFELSSDAINILPGSLVPPLPAAIDSLAPPGQRTYPDFSENSVLLVSNLNPNVSLFGGTDASINFY